MSESPRHCVGAIRRLGPGFAGFAGFTGFIGFTGFTKNPPVCEFVTQLTSKS